MFLSKDGEALLAALYDAYLKRRKSGLSKREAIWFGNADDIHSDVLPEWLIDDIDYSCEELCDAGYMVSGLGPSDACTNHIGMCYFLTNKAIMRMEEVCAVRESPMAMNTKPPQTPLNKAPGIYDLP